MDEGETRPGPNRAEQIATWLCAALLLLWLALLARALLRDFWVILIALSQS